MANTYDEDSYKMNVVLSITNTSRWNVLVDLIEGHKVEGFAGAKVSLEDGIYGSYNTLLIRDVCSVDQLTEISNNSAVNTVIVFYQQAEYYLAEAVRLGASLSRCAEHWQSSTNYLLKIQRKNRAHIKLVNIEQTLAAQNIFSEQLVNLHVNTTDKPVASFEQDVSLIAACQYVAQESGLSQLNNLLQASGLLLQVDNKVLLEVERIVEGYVDEASKATQVSHELEVVIAEKNIFQKDLKAANEKNNELLKLYNEVEQAYRDQLIVLNSKLADHADRLNVFSEDKDLLLSQLHQVQEELEKNVIEKNKVLRDLDESINECDSLHTKQKELVAQLNESENEKVRLLSQLNIVQDELKKYSIEKDAYVATHKAEKLKLQHLFEKMECDTKDTNAKLLEKLSEKASAHDELKIQNQQQENKLKGIVEENSLLLLQLHKVQEDLERLFIEKKDTHIKQKQYQREIIKLENKLRNTTADLASKNYRLDLILQDVDEMKRSVFWKTGAPVRVVASMLNKSKKQRIKLEKEIELILSSEFFDAQWYLEQYPDVAESSISPAEHYLIYGGSEQRFPGPLFSGVWYTETYPDVAESGINPLLHYIKFGKAEGRTASVKLLENLSKREEV
ncbi:hypothetical protein [uncultured Amphritea sp.]|uniref:hypothetical protein n=1 Tax=uncultured Amphritea sp. TaxID=981605 RepID=UPI00262FA3AA|nr:hypothetical protein [uncultured Amphritea sp.]